MWTRRSHSSQAQSTASHCRLTSPAGEWLFTDGQYGLLWLAAKQHQGHATGSRQFQNGRILSRQFSYLNLATFLDNLYAALHCDSLNSVHVTSDKLKQRETLHCLSVITKTQARMSIGAGPTGMTTRSYVKQDKKMGNVTRSRTILTMHTQ